MANDPRLPAIEFRHLQAVHRGSVQPPPRVARWARSMAEERQPVPVRRDESPVRPRQPLHGPVGVTAVISLPASAATVVIADVRRFGRERLETGGFLLAANAAPTEITGVALAGVAGITRRRDMFSVSGLALDRLFTWADEQEL